MSREKVGRKSSSVLVVASSLVSRKVAHFCSAEFSKVDSAGLGGGGGLPDMGSSMFWWWQV